MTARQVAFGRYEILGVLGGGGFATVYRAWDPMLQREVALKALLPNLCANIDIFERFLAEARAIASLRHPNIVMVYDVGVAAGQPFFAMELVEGCTLADLTGGRGLVLGDVQAILGALASAIDYIHRAGLVHRDIKAANIMRDRSGRVVLMDFGIARSLDSTHHTQTGVSLGTAETMAPEQIRGEPVGPAADIYALGILAYQLLSGRPPFLGNTAHVLYAQAHVPPPPLAQVRPGLPASVYSAIEASLAKEPSQRPATASEFVQVLAGAAPRPLQPPPSHRVEDRRPAQRTSPATTGGVSPLVIGAAVAGVTLLMLVGLLLVLLARGGTKRTVQAVGSSAASASLSLSTSATPAPPVTIPASGIATAEPSASPPPPPLVTQAQSIGVSADDTLTPCCQVTVAQAEHLGGGALRLLLSFKIHGDSWKGDDKPATMRRIFLADERNRTAALVEVTGSSAFDANVTETSGWYRFAPLAPGARWVWLHYPTSDDGEVIVGFNAGVVLSLAAAFPEKSQRLSLAGTDSNCCRVTVLRAENVDSNSIRLFLFFALIREGWKSDYRSEYLSKIYLEDEQGRHSDLKEVTGPAALDIAGALTMGGWYRFAPLADGVKRVRLHYGGTVIDVDLGAAST